VDGNNIFLFASYVYGACGKHRVCVYHFMEYDNYRKLLTEHGLTSYEHSIKSEHLDLISLTKREMTDFSGSNVSASTNFKTNLTRLAVVVLNDCSDTLCDTEMHYYKRHAFCDCWKPPLSDDSVTPDVPKKAGRGKRAA